MYVGAVDALASLAPAPFRVDLGGHTYTVPPRNARDWLEVLLSAELDVTEILPGFLDPADEMAVDQAMVDGDVTPEELEKRVLELMDETVGHPWWWTWRVLNTLTSAHMWPYVHGRLVRDGVDPAARGLGEWLHAGLSVVRDLIDPQKFQRLMTELDSTPVGVEVELDYRSEEDTF